MDYSHQQAISKALATMGGLNIANLENLATPLQILVKARYFMSVINKEIYKATISSIFNCKKVSIYTVLLHAELKQMPLAFLCYNDEIKAIAEPLPHLTGQLLKTLQSPLNVVSSELYNMMQSYDDIDDCLHEAYLLARLQNAEGK